MAIILIVHDKWRVGCTGVHKIAYRHARLINNIKKYRVSLAYLDRYNYLSFSTPLTLFVMRFVLHAGRFNFHVIL